MKRDIGFWDISGNYIEDIQEVDERELTMTDYTQSIINNQKRMIVQGYYSDVCEPDTDECKECMNKCEDYWKSKGYEE